MNRNHIRHAVAWLIVLALAPAAFASRVGNGAAGAPKAPPGAKAEAVASQADDSNSLRQGTITAINERGDRLQVQGVWCDVGAGQTMLIRDGQQARLDSLKTGELIRFTLAPGASERPVLRVIYAQ